MCSLVLASDDCETSASATISASEIRSVVKCARAASTQTTRGSTLPASALGAIATPVVVASSSLVTSGGSKPARDLLEPARACRRRELHAHLGAPAGDVA